MFVCDRCGCCCRSIRLSSIYVNLDRGDGTCKFFDENTSLCSIYPYRPIFCNIDAMYNTYFVQIMPQEEYYEINYQSCRELKKRFQNTKEKKHGYI